MTSKGSAFATSWLGSDKLAGVDPHRYVLEATRRAMSSPGTVTLPEDVT